MGSSPSSGTGSGSNRSNPARDRGLLRNRPRRRWGRRRYWKLLCSPSSSQSWPAFIGNCSTLLKLAIMAGKVANPSCAPWCYIMVSSLAVYAHQTPAATSSLTDMVR